MGSGNFAKESLGNIIVVREKHFWNIVGSRQIDVCHSCERFIIMRCC